MTDTRAGRPSRPVPRALVSLAIAVAMVVLVFPDVVFLGGSFTTDRLSRVVDPTLGPDPVSFYPNVENRAPGSGMNDAGARSWQYVTAPKYLHRSLTEGENPHWNPYSASGSLGSERLVDMALSPFVVIVALLGASAAAFTFTLLAFLAFGIYCLLQFFDRTLQLPRLAGIAAALVYLLCGWSTAMLGSQMAAPYVLFPVGLYALCELLRLRTPLRLLAAVAAYAAILASTLLSTALLMLLLIHATAFVFDLHRRRDVEPGSSPLRRVRDAVIAQALVPILALLVTAYVWLPILDALRGLGEETGPYAGVGDLVFRPRWSLSLFTPRHIYTSYVSSTWPDEGPFPGIFYVGLAPLVLVAGALPRARGPVRSLLAVSVVALGLAVAQHLPLPILGELQRAPGLAAIGPRYWGALVGAATTLSVGLAVAVALRAGLAWPWTAGAASIIALLLVAAYATSSRTTDLRAAANTAAAVVLLSAAVALVVLMVRQPARRWLFVALAVALVGVELFSYLDPARPRRIDIEDHLPEYVAFLERSLGDQRVYNIGRGGIHPEWGAALGIRQIGTVLHVQAPWYREFFFERINPAERRGKFLWVSNKKDVRFSAQPEALDLLSVRYLVVDRGWKEMDEAISQEYLLVLDDTDAGIRAYENPDAYPRAFLTPAVRPPAGEDDLWSRTETLTEDDELLELAAEAGVATEAPPDVDEAAETGRAEIVADHHDHVTIEGDAPRPSLLVLADSYQKGWSAEVDGEPAHLGRVDETVRGVVVPAGRSTVELRYESMARTWGTVVSLTSIAGLLIACVAWEVLRRRAARSSPPTAPSAPPSEEVVAAPPRP